MQKSGESYITPGSQIAPLSASNNLWYGAGLAQAEFSANVNTDPLLAISGSNFILASGSPAIDAGAATAAMADIIGNPSPLGAAYDIGAMNMDLESRRG